VFGRISCKPADSSASDARLNIASRFQVRVSPFVVAAAFDIVASVWPAQRIRPARNEVEVSGGARSVAALLLHSQRGVATACLLLSMHLNSVGWGGQNSATG
jgi:hypothetical protein